jgi:hypothetical protein
MYTVRARVNVFRPVVGLFPFRAAAKLAQNPTHMRNKLYTEY